MTKHNLFIVAAVTLGSTGAFAEEKHPDDPTKIVTKALALLITKIYSFLGLLGLMKRE